MPLISCTAVLLVALPAAVQEPIRARDLGIPFDGRTGEWNAITDVQGVLVGHTTVQRGQGAQAARTGVTAVLANRDIEPIAAAFHSLNGDGEMTGTHFIAEKGALLSPVLLTNTISVGTVHEAVIRWSLAEEKRRTVNLPVVAETWDGFLNDIYGFHVQADHVFAALDGAATGPVAEGNVGGGTGMMCHWFKGGIGTSSRLLDEDEGGWTVGVLVQANYGARPELRIAGVPVGVEIEDRDPIFRQELEGDGSIIILIATDAPLLPVQLRRVAQRASLGLGRVGSYASTWSGDLFLAFSTAGSSEGEDGLRATRFLGESDIDPIFLATVQATEEAIINALVAAQDMTGVHGNQVFALPHDRVQEILLRHGRLRKGD